MGELLLELLSEEIPARMQRRAIEDLTALIRGKLELAQIPAERFDSYVTPRRLTVVATGIPQQQPERSEERRGPRVGAPPAALDGFLRATGLHSIRECEIRDTGRGEFYFALLLHPGRSAAEVLPQLLRAAIDELPWPKSMRFPAASFRWVRPLISVVCLFDGEIVPLQLDGIPVGRTTRGHRFLSEGDITVDNAADYRDRLEAAYVILDHHRRHKLIAADLDRLAAAKGLMVKPDPGLLDEVAGLVEFPVVLMGAIDDASMSLPAEVLATAMRTHQKYFSCLKPGGMPAPHFLFIANNLTADDGKATVAGNERVLRARLSDARFFWDQDRRVPLESRVAALKDRVFYDKLGSMYDKVQRMEKLAAFIIEEIAASSRSSTGQEGAAATITGGLNSYIAKEGAGLRVISVQAAHLAKADLSTGTVGEFPELQGIMGRYYAQHDCLDERVVDAIAEHYRPLGPHDTVPTAPTSIVVALADKIDSVVAFFSIGERPTGSGDPFALRRAAQGIIRIILENKLRLPLASIFAYSNQLILRIGLACEGKRGSILDELLTFIGDRLKVHLRDKGVRHDLISAAFAKVREDNGDLVRLMSRVDALRAFLETEDGASLLTAYRRSANIVAIEERRGATRYDDPVDSTLFQQPEEVALYHRLNGMRVTMKAFLDGENFDRAMGRLATLRQPVDEFFGKVTVNTDDQALRENRLRLLSRIRAVMNQVADFSQIEG